MMDVLNCDTPGCAPSDPVSTYVICEKGSSRLQQNGAHVRLLPISYYKNLYNGYDDSELALTLVRVSPREKAVTVSLGATTLPGFLSGAPESFDQSENNQSVSHVVQ